MNFIFKKIHNPGLKYLLIFSLVSVFNDFWSLIFGIPTLFHLVFLLTFFLFPRKNIKKTSFLKNVYYLLCIYLFILVVNTLISTIINYYFETKVLSVFFKSIFILILIPSLTKVKFYEIILFFKYLSIILIFFTLIPGFIEFLLNKNLLAYEYGISKDTFYIRGLSIDKIDYSFFLVILIASLLSFHKYFNINKYLSFSVIIISCFLLVYSFSTTNILGLLISFIYFLYNQKGKVKNFFFFTILILSIVKLTDNYLVNYKLKFEYQSDKSQIGNEFRSRAFDESVDYFLESPLFGHGIGSNAKMLKKRVDYIDKEINSHNFINEFTDFGFIGGCTLLSLVLVVFLKGFKQRNTKNPIFIFWIIITGPIISRFVFYYHYFDKFCFLFWISITILMVSFNAENNSNKIIIN
tara:strand:+ start:19309 stop:20535 length:1227 start_codon:yes stop_codon:yes gene_type:complete